MLFNILDKGQSTQPTSEPQEKKSAAELKEESKLLANAANISQNQPTQEGAMASNKTISIPNIEIKSYLQ